MSIAKRFLPITFLFFVCHLVYSQSDQLKKKRYSFSGIVGISRAKFKVTGADTEEYPTLEARLGGGISGNLNNWLQIKSGFIVCFRAKRKSYLIDDIYYYGKGTLSLLLDDTASKKNHVAFEIPLSLQFLLGKSHFKAGVMGRSWLPTDMVGDALRSRQEFGYIAGAGRKISPNLTIGVDFYWELKGIGFILNSAPTRMRNRFAQVSLEYNLNRLLKKK